MNDIRSSPAVRLPHEILIEILRISAARSHGIHLTESRRVYNEPILRAAPLVCKAWLPPATDVLYEHVHLPSSEALKLFMRSLKTSPKLCTIVRSCSFVSSLRYNLRKVAQKQALSEIDILDKLCSVCPSLADLQLMVMYTRSSLSHVNNVLPMSKITTLRLTAPTLTVEDVMHNTLAFPALLNLSIEGCFLASGTTWPDIPQLRSLHLSKCVITGEEVGQWLKGIQNLRELKIEYIFVDSGALLASLRLFSSTLESFHINSVLTSGFRSEFRDLTFLTSLRHLFIGPTNGFSLDHINHLPRSLQQLTILEAAESSAPFTHYFGDIRGVEGLLQLLNVDPGMHYPSLELITVKGNEARWAAWDDSFKEKFEDIGIQFQLQTFEHPLIATYRSPKRSTFLRKILRRLR